MPLSKKVFEDRASFDPSAKDILRAPRVVNPGASLAETRRCPADAVKMGSANVGSSPRRSCIDPFGSICFFGSENLAGGLRSPRIRENRGMELITKTTGEFRNAPSVADYLSFKKLGPPRRIHFLGTAGVAFRVRRRSCKRRKSIE